MKKSLSNATHALALAGAMLSGVVIAAGGAPAQAQTPTPIPTQAQNRTSAASPVVLTSDVQIERVEIDATGKEKIMLYTPRQIAVVPGDKVVFSLEVTNSGAAPAVGFRATNPVPGAVQFASVAEDWAEVSVDGGSHWGRLATLKVKSTAADGGAAAERAAGVADVTHVRWVFADAIAPGTKRTISYRGVVK